MASLVGQGNEYERENPRASTQIGDDGAATTRAMQYFSFGGIAGTNELLNKVSCFPVLCRCLLCRHPAECGECFGWGLVPAFMNQA